MIVGSPTCFKRMKVSTLMEFDVPVSSVEAFVTTFPLPQLPVLLIETIVVGPSTRVVLEKDEFKDAFANLALG